MSETISLRTACHSVIQKAPVSKITKVLEYKNLFVFEVTPGFVGFIAVNKDTGGIFGFNPMCNEPDKFFKEWEENSAVIKGVSNGRNPK